MFYEMYNGSFEKLRKVFRQELGHTKSTDAVGTENLCHLFVRGEVLLVVGILQVVLLEVCPQFFDAFGTASFLLANDGSKVLAELHGFGKSSSFRHFDFFVGSGLIESRKANPHVLCFNTTV